MMMSRTARHPKRWKKGEGVAAALNFNGESDPNHAEAGAKMGWIFVMGGWADRRTSESAFG